MIERVRARSNEIAVALHCSRALTDRKTGLQTDSSAREAAGAAAAASVVYSLLLPWSANRRIDRLEERRRERQGEAGKEEERSN